MPITDLFSHKIHSNDPEWPDKLVELASLFSQFDGQVFDRKAIEERLMTISPRSAYAPRDPSKFRDEITAYPAYLGLYRLETSTGGWVLRVSKTAKHFLLTEEPNVGAFMRLQLALFQYPNGMGVAYVSHTNNARIQANARDRTLEFISKGLHLSPLRMICKALAADANLRSQSLLDSAVTYEEIFALANSGDVNKLALPNDNDVALTLELIRKGKILPPVRFERRFHTLRHTEMFELEQGGLRFRTPVDNDDKGDLLAKIDAVSNIRNQFEGFDKASSGNDLEKLIASGDWGRYFDAIDALPTHVAETLGSDIVDIMSAPVPSITHFIQAPTTYRLQARPMTLPIPAAYDRHKELADPEQTRIKRQRRNLEHKKLIGRMDELLRKLGAAPMDNPHIDLYGLIPNDGSFLFEMKSGGESLLDQIRKGVSQLYEYRFRYRTEVSPKSTLCLVLSKAPSEIPWVYEYLCQDRGIALCWFDDSGALKYPDTCKGQLEGLSVSGTAS